MSIKVLYDKTGAAFTLDHECGDTAYVRPMVKVIVQVCYGEDCDETEDYEPADYLVARKRSDLFDAPPIEVVNEEISAKISELNTTKSETQKAVRTLNSEKATAERELTAAKRQLDEWMKKHRVLVDLGKLLDGEVLYPLSVKENSYHHSRDIPRIPKMRNMSMLCVTSGNFETGQPWNFKTREMDAYGLPFQFFDTEEERAAVIRDEFDAACAAFREKPNFDTTSHTTSTRLHYGTLMEWVKTHPALNIPEDIEAMKRDNDAYLVQQRKEKLSAELAEIEARHV